jgi:glutamate dehydrogenase/leucine dehydrogenase
MGVFDQMTSEGHEEVLFGFDRVSGLRSIIAIHSTVLGPALGGTRFFAYPDEASALRDVLRLSQGMTLKAAAAGLDLGGGKAVIIGNPATDRSERLLRAYGRVVDSFDGRFITAEDVGTSGADMEVIRRETPWALGIPVEDGGSGDPSPSTARGLMAALQAVARHLWNDDQLHGRRVAVQGVGKVGGALVELLVEAGCEVVIADVNDESVALAVDTYGVKAVEPDEILSVPCDVLSPCGMGGVLDSRSILGLRCEAVVGSANNQLADDGDDLRLADVGILYAPDFVVNSGGLINVAEELGGYRSERAARRVQAVGAATSAILRRADQTGTTPHRAATEVAEERLASIGELRRWRRRG